MHTRLIVAFLFTFSIFFVGCSGSDNTNSFASSNATENVSSLANIQDESPTATPVPERSVAANPTAAPKTISFPANDTFDLDVETTHQEWIFQGQKGQTIRIFSAPSGADNDDALMLTLYASDGTTLARGEEFIGGILPYDGSYTVSATRQNAGTTSKTFSLFFRLGVHMKAHIREVLIGEAAYAKSVALDREAPHLNEGWDFVVVDIAIENIGHQPGYGLDRVAGWLTDSGGYTHEITWFFSPFTREFIDDQYFYPGIRLPYFAYTQVPANQTPESITLAFTHEGTQLNYEFDIEDTHPEITIPFEAPPAHIPLLENEYLHYTEEGMFELEYTEFYFRENQFHEGHVTLELAARIENLWGYDLNDRAIEDDLYYIAVDNKGDIYVSDAPTSPWEDVGPGIVHEWNPLLIVLGRPFEDFDWIWVAFFEPNGRPIGQITLEAPQRSEIRPAP